jgi:hypothetical protein
VDFMLRCTDVLKTALRTWHCPRGSSNEDRG